MYVASFIFYIFFVLICAMQSKPRIKEELKQATMSDGAKTLRRHSPMYRRTEPVLCFIQSNGADMNVKLTLLVIWLFDLSLLTDAQRLNYLMTRKADPARVICLSGSMRNVVPLRTCHFDAVPSWPAPAEPSSNGAVHLATAAVNSAPINRQIG